MNHAILIPRRRRKNQMAFMQRLRKRISDVCTFWRNFAHYLKRGHWPRTAWDMARNTL